jgi:hypothetical protein
MSTITRTRRAAAGIPAQRTRTPAPDSPEAAAGARARADQMRALGIDARAEAAAVVQAAREQLAAAERRAQALLGGAHRLDAIATDLESVAAMTDVVRASGQQADQAEAAHAALEAEAAGLAARADELDARMGELTAERQRLAAAVATARQATDVQALTALRPQLSALDEVAADLTAELQNIRTRQQQIGAPGAYRLLDQVATEAQTARARHTQGMEALGPAYVDLQTRARLINHLKSTERAESDAERERNATAMATLEAEPAFTGMLATARAHAAAASETRTED